LIHALWPSMNSLAWLLLMENFRNTICMVQMMLFGLAKKS
jgi:hypothetical protein